MLFSWHKIKMTEQLSKLGLQWDSCCVPWQTFSPSDNQGPSFLPLITKAQVTRIGNTNSLVGSLGMTNRLRLPSLLGSRTDLVSLGDIASYAVLHLRSIQHFPRCLLQASDVCSVGCTATKTTDRTWEMWLVIGPRNLMRTG